MLGDFRLGAWWVRPSQNTIECDGKAVRLEPKAVEVLACLAENAGETVPKERLIRAVWGDTSVTDDVLIRSISELRKALDDDPKEPHVIETIPKRGYRLLLPKAEKEEWGLDDLARIIWYWVITTRLSDAWKSQRNKAEFLGLKWSPYWDPLRADPRFQKLLRRMNFPDT
jgi:DNA-binding winged helix-turn-helix (wHTH) protein